MLLVLVGVTTNETLAGNLVDNPAVFELLNLVVPLCALTNKGIRSALLVINQGREETGDCFDVSILQCANAAPMRE